MAIASSRRQREGIGEGPVEIVIKANDQASTVFRKVASGVTVVWNELGKAKVAAASLGAAAVFAAEGAVKSFMKLAETLNLVKGLMQLAPVQAYWEKVKKSFDSTIGDVQLSLTQSLSGVVEAALSASKGAAVGTNFGQAVGTSIAGRIGASLNAIDTQILSMSGKVEKGFKALPSLTKGVSAAAGPLAGMEDPIRIFEAYRGTVQKATSLTFRLTQEIGQFSVGLSALKQFVAAGPFSLLIDQNVRLREQLLSTQSTLAATNRVLVGGTELRDPTTAIKALRAPVEAAISAVRRGSLDLVGVTSKDLISVYEIISGQISGIGGDLQDASDLTLDFSAALGTLAVPLDQSRQEINSIIQGQITSDSYLAKAIGLTNQQVQLWRQQNVVVERLRERLEAFRAGNALAAQTLKGVSSNIQEIFDEIFRRAGEPLLDPILAQLNRFYELLKANSSALQAYVTEIVLKLQRMGDAAISAVEAVAGLLGKSVSDVTILLFESLAEAVEVFAGAIKRVVPYLQPFVAFLEQMIASAGTLSPFFKVFATFKVAEFAIKGLTGAFKQFSYLVPGLGEVMDFLTVRTNSFLNTFLNLQSRLGTGGAGFLLLGQNIQKFPPIVEGITKALGPLAPTVIGLIPATAGLGFNLMALSEKFPAVKGFLEDIGKQIPGAVGGVAQFAKTTNLGGGALKNFAPMLDAAASKLGSFKDSQELVNEVNDAFGKLMKQSALSVRTQIIQYGLMGVALYGLFFAVDNLILKNEGVKASLAAIGSILGKVGNAVLRFLKEPFVLASIAIASLIVLIQTGLIPSLLKSAAAALQQASAFAVENFQKFLSTMTQVKVGTDALAASSIRLRVVSAIQAEYEAYRKSLLATEVATKMATASNNTFMLSLARAQGVQAAVTVSSLAMASSYTRLGAVQTLVGRFGALRASLAATLVQMKSIDFFAFARGLLISSAATTTATASTNGLSLSLIRLNIVQAIEARMVAFRAAIAALATQMQAVNIAGFVRYLVTSGTVARGATAAMAGLSKGIMATAAAVKALVISMGPIAGMLLAIAAASEVVQVLHSEFFAGNTILKEYKESLKELEEEVRRARAATAEPGKGPTKDFEGDALADIKQKQNFVSKGFRFLEEKARVAASRRSGLSVDTIKEMGGVTNAERELNKRIGDQGEVIVEAGKRAENYKQQISSLKGRLQELVDQYNDGQISEEDFAAQTEKINAEIKANTDLVGKDIENLHSMTGATETQEQALRAMEEGLKDVQKGFEGLQNVSIDQKKLPYLGTQLEQLIDKAKQAEEAITKGAGDPQIFAGKAKELLDVTQQLLDQNIITEDEALRRLSLIANNTQLDVEIVASAQQAMTQIIQGQSKERISFFDSEKAQIQAKVKTGQITAEEGEKQLTEAIKNEGKERLAALDAEYEAMKRNREEQQRLTITNIESSIIAMQGEARRARQAGANSRAESIEKDIAASEQKLAGLKASYNQQALKSEEEYQNSRKQIEAETVVAVEDSENSIYQARLRNLERVQQEAVDKARESELNRQLQTERLLQQGVIRKEEANQRDLSSTLEKNKAELKAEQDKLAALEKEKKLDDPEAEEERQRQIRDSRNRTKELTLDILKGERELVEGNIKLLEQELTRAAREYSNELERQVQAITRQQQLGKELERSLQQRLELLKAEEGLLSATSNFMASEMDALAQTTRSEYRKQQIAQTTAAIKYQSALIQSQYAMESLKLEIEQNRIARDREETENRIAILRKQGEIRQGDAEVKVAKESYNKGLIDKSELDKVIIDQENRYLDLQGLYSERTLIQEQRANDERMAGIKVMQQMQTNRSNERQAQLGLAQALPPGLRERALQDLGNQIAQDLGYRDSTSLINSGVALARDTAGSAFTGAGSLQTSPLSAYDPELEVLRERLSPAQFSQVVAASQAQFSTQMGAQAYSQFQPQLLGAGAAPLQLPPVMAGGGPGGSAQIIRLTPEDALGRRFQMQPLGIGGNQVATTDIDRLVSAMSIRGSDGLTVNFESISVSAGDGEAMRVTENTVREQLALAVDAAYQRIKGER